MARATALVGGTMVALRRFGAPAAQAVGAAPTIPHAKKQGSMTLKMPIAKGWAPGQVPEAAPGLNVNAFASNLDHPRWIYVLPSGDVLVAESKEQAGPPKLECAPAGGQDQAAALTMARA